MHGTMKASPMHCGVEPRSSAMTQLIGMVFLVASGCSSGDAIGGSSSQSGGGGSAGSGAVWRRTDDSAARFALSCATSAPLPTGRRNAKLTVEDSPAVGSHLSFP